MPISKEEAVGQIIGVLFAGSETTANMISECIYELAIQPHIQENLRSELKKFYSVHGRSPAFEDLMSATALPYLDAVARETVRTKAVLREIGRMVSVLSRLTFVLSSVDADYFRPFMMT